MPFLVLSAGLFLFTGMELCSIGRKRIKKEFNITSVSAEDVSRQDKARKRTKIVSENVQNVNRLKSEVGCQADEKKRTKNRVKEGSRKRRRKKRYATEQQKPKMVKKTISAMNFQELKQSKEALVADGNKEIAIKYAEKMIPLCTDMRELAQLMIELGDLYYQTRRLTKAFTVYREFVNLYPGSDHVEYALYRAIVCKFDEIADAERDQSQTKETIELALEFLERAELFVAYKEEIEAILTKCRNRLFENEVSIFNFYLFNKRMAAANKRLDSIKKDFINMLPDAEPRIILLELDLAQAQKNEQIAQLKQEELITKFPDYVIRTAQNIPKKKSLIERF